MYQNVYNMLAQIIGNPDNFPELAVSFFAVGITVCLALLPLLIVFLIVRWIFN